MSGSDRKRVVVVGSSFAGLTAALELRKRVGDRHEIVVLDPRPDFTLAIEDLDAMCILDAGNNGVIFKADHVLARNGDAQHARIMAGPQAHWAKVAFEHVFLATRKRGVLAL